MNLKDYLTGKKISPYKFADWVGVTPRTVYGWMNREKFPNPENAAAIAAVTKGEVTANDFYHPQLG